MQLYFNLANSAVTTDLGTLLTLDINNPVQVFEGDSPTLLLTFHWNGAPVIPTTPLIRFVVKKLGDYEGTAFVLCEAYTPPSGDATAFTLLPDFSTTGAGSLFEYLLPSPVVSRPADQVARYALSGGSYVVGAVVQQADTGAYWQVADPTNLSNSAGWTSDVTLESSGTLGAQFVVLPAPGYARQTSAAFWLQIDASYWQGDETAPTGGTPFGLGIVLNFASVTALTGGDPGDLDAVPTVGSQVLVGALAALNLAAGPYFWRLKQAAAIVSSSVATDTVITTETPHGLAAGQGITIGGHAGSTPAINGTTTVLAVTDATHFTIATDVTIAGTGGFVTPATDAAGAGVVRPADFDAADNPVFWQSAA